MRITFPTAVVSLLLSGSAFAQGILIGASTRDELRDEFAAAVSALPGVVDTAETGGRRLALVRSWDKNGKVVDEAPAQLQFILDSVVFDPEDYARLMGSRAAALAQLSNGEVALSATSAEVRRLGVGGRLALADGTTLTVAAIVPDNVMQNREVAIAEPGFGFTAQRRMLIIRYNGPEDSIEQTLTGLLPPKTPLWVRALQPSSHLRQSPVLPLVRIKQALGEFAYRPTKGRQVERDRRWETANIVTAEVPVLGRVRCHRVLVTALRGAMQELIEQDIAHLVVREAYRGCDNPRLIAAGRNVSRHAWGAAVDLNFSSDAEVRRNATDPRLLEVMGRWGFISGHTFNNPDPGHFEYFGPPAATASGG